MVRNMDEMTLSQINPPKGGGFSANPCLKTFVKAESIKHGIAGTKRETR